VSDDADPSIFVKIGEDVRASQEHPVTIDACLVSETVDTRGRELAINEEKVHGNLEVDEQMTKGQTGICNLSNGVILLWMITLGYITSMMLIADVNCCLTASAVSISESW